MMKLTKENIDFIDNYLKRKEVRYYDYRIELLDHIASSMEKNREEETDFHNAFLKAIAENQDLILSKTKNSLQLFKTTFANYFASIWKYSSLWILMISIGLALLLIQELEGMNSIKFIIQFNFAAIITVLGFQLICFGGYRLISKNEYLFYVLSIIHLLFILIPVIDESLFANFNTSTVFKIYLSGYLFLEILLLKSIVLTVVKSKKIYGKIKLN